MDELRVSETFTNACNMQRFGGDQNNLKQTIDLYLQIHKYAWT